MSTSEQPTEEELRAVYEAEMKRLRVEQVLLESVVSMVNLGMRRTGLAPGTEDERDPGQVHLAIEAVRALTALIEQVLPEQAGPIRDAVSQLQLAFVKIGGQAPAGAGAPPVGGPPPPAGGPPPPAGAGAPPAGGPPPPGGEGAPRPEAAPPPAPDPAKPGEPGPAQRSGRLWIPGQ